MRLVRIVLVILVMMAMGGATAEATYPYGDPHGFHQQYMEAASVGSVGLSLLPYARVVALSDLH